MYIKRIEIKNIRSIEHFEMTFAEGKEAGWHVLIGENGSGKSTIVRSVAACLVGEEEIAALRLSWSDWKRKGSQSSVIKVDCDDHLTSLPIKMKVGSPERVNLNITQLPAALEDAFSAAYGPFRRFTGGNKEWDKVGKAYPRAAAHMSAFGEDIALAEALDYIRELYISDLDNTIDPEKKDKIALVGIIKFINRSKLLPNGARILSVNSESINVIVANDTSIPITQLSDGFRSILSLVLDLLQRLILVFGSHKVLLNILDGGNTIDLPGVVLIDEIDAHLHPTWQTRIGQWFTTYFPNIQFIVTTHSPLICRAAEKGSIWRLAAPGTDEQSGEVTGTDRDRLIYGNILDAYGTEVFGRDVERSDESKDKLQRLAHLSQVNTFGTISDKEELQSLRKILTTDDTTEY